MDTPPSSLEERAAASLQFWLRRWAHQVADELELRARALEVRAWSLRQ